MAKVDFAIIGVPKSATTFVHWALRSHPDIAMEENENSAFNGDNWASRITQLLKQAETGQHRLCGVKRPDMIFNTESANRMKGHNPAVKAIAILRHPAVRTVAHYFHLMKYSFLPLVDFTTGVEALLNGEMQKNWPRSWEVLDFSRYSEAMTHYADALGDSNVHFVTHDDVKKNSEDVIRDICEFLGIDFDQKTTLPDGRPQKVMYSLERIRFLRHANEAVMELDEFDRAQRFRDKPLTQQENDWNWMVKQFDEKGMAQSHSNKPPRMSVTLWETLYAYFRDDIVQVETLLGRELPAWHTNPLA